MAPRFGYSPSCGKVSSTLQPNLHQCLISSEPRDCSLLASGQLAGQQQANRVANRIEQLEQLAGIDRQLIGDISRNRESELSRQTALQAGLGGQIANVGFGLAGPAVESIQTQAEISGLRGIASAKRSADNASAMANLAGQVFTPSNITSAYDFFSPAPTQTTPTYIPTQAGRTNVNFSPAGSGNLNYQSNPTNSVLR